MNSLVVGGAGFVGSWVVENLLKETNGEIFIVDNLISVKNLTFPLARACIL